MSQVNTTETDAQTTTEANAAAVISEIEGGLDVSMSNLYSRTAREAIYRAVETVLRYDSLARMTDEPERDFSAALAEHRRPGGRAPDIDPDGSDVTRAMRNADKARTHTDLGDRLLSPAVAEMVVVLPSRDDKLLSRVEDAEDPEDARNIIAAAVSHVLSKGPSSVNESDPDPWFGLTESEIEERRQARAEREDELLDSLTEDYKDLCHIIETASETASRYDEFDTRQKRLNNSSIARVSGNLLSAERTMYNMFKKSPRGGSGYVPDEIDQEHRRVRS